MFIPIIVEEIGSGCAEKSIYISPELSEAYREIEENGLSLICTKIPRSNYSEITLMSRDLLKLGPAAVYSILDTEDFHYKVELIIKRFASGSRLTPSQ